uniref:Ribonuclease H-like domain, reverse transcriptase, RNA-dependent DNA polymerase n=1 Tax=Tanacetum cinerariifolium TaxID=118510 RepID=A0A6L2JYX8_TANCI|nr:ribonuclease H-like domain, reverse transcriptase, RNA-dependent DNA polymerase [Tanacetum cinerariifolium]
MYSGHLEEIALTGLAKEATALVKKISEAHALVSYIHKQRRTNHKDYKNCLFAYFLSQMEPKKKVWRLVDLLYEKKAIGTKWVYRNKKDERSIVVRIKARLVAQGRGKEERIDYDEVFALVARIEAIRIFLASASFMGFIVYQMDDQHPSMLVGRVCVSTRREGLDKGYNRFQRLLSLLKVHGADDMYNNLKVYEADIKGSFGSSSNSQDVTFISAESTSSTNELNATYSVSTATGHSSQAQGSLSYDDELMFSCFTNQFSTLQLDNEDLEQTNQDDLEEMDLKWQVAMLSMRVERFFKKTMRKLEFNGKEPVGFDKTNVECFNCHRRGHFARDCRSARNSGNRSRDAGNAGYRGRDNGKRPAKEEDEQALVVQDGLEKEVTKTVFNNCSSDKENSLTNDRFKKGDGYHAVPPPLTGNYMSPKPDLSFAGLDDSIYKFKISETVASLTKDEKDALETSIAYVERPKEDRSNALLIQDWDTDSVFRPEPILAKIDFVKADASVKHVKPVESIKHNEKITQKLGLGFGFIKKACFVCGSMSRLIKDYTFHEDRMAKKSVLPNNRVKGTGHKESRPVWNNVQRINHQNKFAPTAVFTRSGRIPLSAAKPKAAASTSTAKPVNTAGPKQSVNFSKSRSTFHTSHSPTRMSFYNATAHPRRNSTERVNTTGSKAVSAVKGNRVTAVKTSTGCVWRPRVNEIDQLSKDNRWICTCVDYVDPQGRLKALVTKTHNKTPYELLNGRTPRLYFMRPFGCLVTILNTLDPLGKFKGKVDEGFLVEYSVTSKDVRVFNTKIRKVEENLHVKFLENKPNVAGTGPNWLFDIGSLTNSKNYIPVSIGNRTDKNAGPQDTNGNADDKAKDDKPKDDTGSKTVEEPVNKEDQAYRYELDRLMSQETEPSDAANSLRKDNPVNYASPSGTFSVGGPSSPHPDAFIPANTILHVNQDDSQILDLEDTIELQSIGHGQKERIDYDEVFAPVARIEAIRIFLAFASFMGFSVYQIGVKSAFLYGTIKELVYVCQPSGFIDPQFPNKVYKVDKALYGLHQAPRAWYETLSTFLLQNGYSRETIDKTSFIKKEKYDIMLVQVFVDDIIFGSTKKSLYSTPIETHKSLVKDKEAADVDVHLYRSMIGSLMYLTASRPGIMCAVYACSRFQVTPKLSHLHAVKRIFRYLKCQPKLVLWYPRDSPFDLEAYSDSAYAGANLNRKSTTRGRQFLGRRLISWQCKKQTIVATSTTKVETEANAEFHQIVDFLSTCLINYALTVSLTIYASYIEQFWNTATSKIVNSVKQIHAIVDGKAVVISESLVRSDLLFNDEDGGGDSVERAITTDASLVTAQDNDNITKTQSTTMSNDLISQEIGSGDRPRCQETTLRDTDAQTRRLEKKRKARTSQPVKRRLFKGRVETSSDKSLEVIVEDKGSGEKGGGTADQVSTARPEVSTASVLMNLRSEKAKVKKVAFRDVEEPPRLTRSTSTLQLLPTIDPKDKGKGVLVKEEPEKLEKVKRRDQGLAQIKSDAEFAQRIYKEELAELDRAQKEKQKQKEVTIATLTKELDEIQARMDVDHELAKKQLAAERVEAIRNKSPTRTQIRNMMITYLKHMEPESKGKKGKRIKRVADSALKQKSSKKQKMMQEQESTKSDEEELA